MNQYLVGMTVFANTNLPNQEVLEQMRKLIGLGIAAASKLARESADEKESAELAAIAELGIEVIKVNNHAPEYSPNTLYVLGTDTKGTLVVRGSRSSFDAVKDTSIMHAALELSQAVELRNVSFPEHRVGALLVRPATQGSRQLLMQKVLASMAGIGDVYTDAREKEGAVRAAENLGILALRLSAETEIICSGKFCCDGGYLCEVDIRADGSFLANTPDDLVEGEWTVHAMGREYLVSRYVGECGDDETWVLTEVGEFYNDYLQTLKL